MSVIDRTDRNRPLEAPDEPVVEGEGPATTVEPRVEHTTDHRPDPAAEQTPDHRPAADDATAAEQQTENEEQTEKVHDPGPREIRFRGPKGLRIRRIRLKSVLKIGSVFFALGYLVTMASLVVIWNVAQRLGFIESIEETLVTSLGLESFDIVGQELFDLAVVGFGLLFAMGLVVTLLLTIVYNATCALFGGLAVETGSLRRPKRVFSLRHRRFITIR